MSEHDLRERLEKVFTYFKENGENGLKDYIRVVLLDYKPLTEDEIRKLVEDAITHAIYSATGHIDELHE